MIKILAACGAGVNSSHQIKSALETEVLLRSLKIKRALSELQIS